MLRKVCFLFATREDFVFVVSRREKLVFFARAARVFCFYNHLGAVGTVCDRRRTVCGHEIRDKSAILESA